MLSTYRQLRCVGLTSIQAYVGTRMLAEQGISRPDSETLVWMADGLRAWEYRELRAWLRTRSLTVSKTREIRHHASERPTSRMACVTPGWQKQEAVTRLIATAGDEPPY